MNAITRFVNKPTSSGRLTYYAAELSCGHEWSEASKPYSPITSLTIGDMVECTICAHHAQAEQWLRDLDYSQVHHARFDPRFGGRYLFYRLDATSPSNFMIVGATPATPAIDAILKTKTNCGPLSPTERA